MFIHALVLLTTDGAICLLFLALWLKRRAGLHTLFLGLTLLGLALGTYVLGCQLYQFWAQVAVGTLLLMAQLAVLYGTASLLSASSPRFTAWHASLALGLTLALYNLLWQTSPQQLLAMTIALSIPLFLLVAFWLYLLHRALRVFSMLLLLQGSVNTATAAGFLTSDLAMWLVSIMAIKAVWLSVLVNFLLRRHSRQHVRTINNMECGVALLSINGLTLEVNRYLLQLLGLKSAQQILNRNIREYLQGPVGGEICLFLTRLRAGQTTEIFRQTSKALRADGRLIPVDVIATAYVESGETFCTLQMTDVSDRLEQEQLVAWVAQHDTLTELPNRFGLSQALLRQQGEQLTRVPAMAYLVIDIDRLKRVNIRFGYRTGDQLIRQVAECVAQYLPSTALLARLDGNQFGVALLGCDPATISVQAQACAEQICALFGQNIQLGSHSLAISVSVGIACYPTHCDQADEALRRAEMAMYEAKRRGRAQVCVFDPTCLSDVTDALFINTALRSAIPQGELRLVYQPIVQVSDGRVRKVEALLRWRSATLGDVPPDQFIQVAEESDIILQLGDWTLRQACAQMVQWGSVARDLIMSVNVSPRQLVAADFLQKIDCVLAGSSIAPWQLELEITERLILDDGVQARCIIQTLRQRGIRIALDDFGTGYSAMNYLTHFQFDSLKIDRTFVQEIASNQCSLGLVSCIVAMGRQMQLELVAEGVETAEQLQVLAGIDCHCVQGYYISRPLAAPQMLQFLMSQPQFASGD